MGLHTLLVQLYQHLRVWWRLLREEQRCGDRQLAWWRRAWVLFRGFTSDKCHLYGGALSRHHYWSDRDVYRVKALNRGYGFVFEKKDILHRVLTVSHAGWPLRGIIHADRVLHEVDQRPERLDSFLDHLSEPLLVRRIDEQGRSRYVLVAPVEQGRLYTLNGKVACRQRLVRFLSRGFWAMFATDTSGLSALDRPWILRITTLRCRERHEMFVAFATLNRVRQPGLVGVGDWVARLDLTTGQITGLRPRRLDTPGFSKRTDEQDTSSRKAGIDPPAISAQDLRAAIKQVLNASLSTPLVNGVTWSLVQHAGAWVIVDGSNLLDVGSAQLFEPLLTQPRVAAVHEALMR